MHSAKRLAAEFGSGATHWTDMEADLGRDRY